MVISSLKNNYVKEVLKLKEKKYRDMTNTYLIEGEHLVIEAYKNNLIKELILEENITFDLDVKTTYVTKEIIKKLSSSVTPSNIIAICYKTMEKELGNKLLMLDNIQDPGNLGTIIRSACAFDIDTIVLSKNTVDLYNDKVIRSTQGMHFSKNIIVRDLKEFISSIKDEYLILGTNVVNGKDVKNIYLKEKCAIIIGNEGQGMSKEVSELCDDFIYIKMNENCESLNAGVAASIIMYEVYNK